MGGLTSPWEKKKEKEREWRKEILRHYKIVSLSDPSQP